MTDGTMQISAVYIAVVTMMAFLYIKVRRLENQLKMQDAVITMLMSEAAPSEFLPDMEKRIDECEIKCQSASSHTQDRCAPDDEQHDGSPEADIPRDVIGSLLSSLVHTGGSAVVYDHQPEHDTVNAVIDEITSEDEDVKATTSPSVGDGLSGSDDEQAPFMPASPGGCCCSP